MKFMLLTDIEGVTGVTTYAQAEGTQYGRDMLMGDLMAVIDAINRDGDHEIVIYDEHMDGRNVDVTRLPKNASVICGKPVETEIWAAEAPVDALIMVGFHGMADIPGALLPHSYYREHRKLLINDLPVGEIGMEAAIAGVYGTPLILVTGDSTAKAEAKALIPNVETAVVKVGYGENEARCFSAALAQENIARAAENALYKLKAGAFVCLPTPRPVTLTVEIMPSDYLTRLQAAGRQLFTDDGTMIIREENIAKAWEKLLRLQKEA